MGLKRRNPARSRLLTAPEVLAVMAAPRAPAANGVRPAEPKAVATPAPRAVSVSNEERHRRIARAAYERAERAGFNIDPLQNWLVAERQIDAELSRLAS